MTIRIITLSIFALLCLAVGGMTTPHLSFAADTGATQTDNPPAANQGGPGRGGHFAEKRQELKEQLMKLPPEQRRAKIDELKQQMSADKAQKLQQRKDEFQNKWNNASPEQRAQFCNNVKQKCAEGGKKFACEIAQSKCTAGQ
jgi:hypothetical protein